MARISPLPAGERGLVVRQSLRQARKRVGLEPEPFAAVARHTPLFLTQGAMELGLERCTKAPARLKELAVLRTAMLVGCEFCCDIGSSLARTHGVTEDELRDLARWRDSERFSEEDRLALELAEAMSRTPEATTDELVAALVARLGEPATLELMAMVAWENFRARMNAAMGFGAQGFSEGAFCVAPDREAAAAA
jgi:AhpD family alkylhydroperoxidase